MGFDDKKRKQAETYDPEAMPQPKEVSDAKEVLLLWAEFEFGQAKMLGPRGKERPQEVFGATAAAQGWDYVCGSPWYGQCRAALFHRLVSGDPSEIDRRKAAVFARNLQRHLDAKPLVIWPRQDRPGNIERVDQIVSQVQITVMERRVRSIFTR